MTSPYLLQKKRSHAEVMAIAARAKRENAWHPQQFDGVGEWFDSILTEPDPSWLRRQAIRRKRNQFLAIAALIAIATGVVLNYV